MKCKLLIWLAVFLVVPSAWANQVEGSYRVEVTAAGGPEPLHDLETRTRALLSEFKVTVEWRVTETFRPRDVLSTTAEASLAHIWLDLRDPARAVLYVVDLARERFLVRVVPLDAGYDEVACESVGTIIQSSVEALLLGATLGVTRRAAEEQVLALESTVGSNAPAPQATPPATPPRRVEKPARRSKLEAGLDLSYRGQALGAGPVLFHGPELGGILRGKSRGPFGAALLSVGYRAPVTWNKAEGGARFEGLGVRLGAGLGSTLGRNLRFTLLALGGLDWFELRPQTSLSGSRPSATFGVWAPILGLTLESELRLTKHVRAWLSLGAEADLLGNHFDLLEDGTTERLLEPWPVQGVVRLGARFLP